MSKREIVLLTLLSFFVGTVVGFLISPVRDGIGNNAGNNTVHHHHKPEENQ